MTYQKTRAKTVRFANQLTGDKLVTDYTRRLLKKADQTHEVGYSDEAAKVLRDWNSMLRKLINA